MKQTERQEFERMKESIGKTLYEKPLTLIIIAFILGVILLLVGLLQNVTAAPQPPQPTLTLNQFINSISTWSLPGTIWILIFIALWLTKWS